MDKSDWAYFFDMLTCKKNLERREPALRLSSCRDKSTKKYSLSSDSDSLRRSYAEVVSSSTSSESEYFYATNRTSLKNFTPTVRSEVKKEGKKDDFDKNKVPFHADKALLFIKDHNLAKLLCKNKGWNTIGEACGGFIEAAPETVDKAELTEVLIKVKVNYTGFLPAFIKIYDEEGRDFTIHTVTHLEERWLRERNPRIHGSFTRNAAESFNEYNPHAEQYTFDRNLAVGRKELNEINLVMDLGHISPLSDTNFSSREGSSYTPSPLSPIESEMVKNSLGNMVMSDQKEWEKQSLKKQGEENDEEANFKRKLTKWLKNTNIRLSSEFNSTCDDVVGPLQIVPPNLNFEKMNDDVIDGEEQDTMG
ncbi:hypothetical protein E5676_scaffold142G003990 [Cucumis melo var. makuwa]|uniref:Uncharacterized protein n=1 Tax=Cucumis melo var. makuwa TaxID=1194695 RepID=A0A5D3DIP5_CUCMM|nr:hypothetical protein E6C27_scaffold460G00770 [Cucumis melo var. makuwa]TYK23338.1 hypothetical protein E5676_scaffold142G003990 [Cucumis melo var. makuwa]